MCHCWSRPSRPRYLWAGQNIYAGPGPYVMKYLLAIQALDSPYAHEHPYDGLIFVTATTTGDLFPAFFERITFAISRNVAIRAPPSPCARPQADDRIP